MALVDRIQVLIDSKADVSGFNKAGRESANLEKSQTGLIGKLNQSKGAMIGWGAAGVAAGVAVVGALKESADAFAETAGGVRDVQRAMHGSAEEASRWVAIADDFGIRSDQVSRSFAKLGKGIASGTLDLSKWGAEVVKARDGSIDMQATVESIATAYNHTNDAAARSELLLTAFGKSGRDLIPILEGGKKAIRDMFAEVPDAQIFDNDDLQKAREYKLAMDNLNDSLNEIALNIGGEVAPLIADMTNSFAEGIRGITGAAKDVDPDLFQRLFDATPLGQFGHALGGLGKIIKGDIVQGLEEIAGKGNPFGALGTGLSDIFGKGDLASRVLDELERKQAGAGHAAGLHAKSILDLGGALDGAFRSMKELNDELEQYENQTLGVQGAQLNLEAAVNDYTASLAANGAESLETRQAQLDMEQSVFALAGAMREGGRSTGEQIFALRTLEGQFPGLTLLIEGYIQTLLGIPPNANTTVTVDDQASAKIAQIGRDLAALNGGVAVVNVRAAVDAAAAAALSSDRNIKTNIVPVSW